ncbi:MAG: quinone oxidoreductase [Anaerolineales bacterium]|nr:quinone oxidoreductase [Anaerolineales bacterium]
MHAIRIHQFGGPEVLGLDDLPVPEPGPGEARVRIEASGLNFIDIYQRTGAYRGALPLTLGQEAAGVVDSAGPDVAEVKAGDRVVYASVLGAYAQYALVPAWRLAPLPPGVSSQQAAAVMLQGLTAHYLTRSAYPLRAGETALVHAAAGGVGQLLVQVCKHLGARVIGTVSNDAKAQVARERGADEVILYTQVDFESEVKRLTGGQGVDVVYDSVGKDTFDKSLNCLRPRGYLVLYGQSSGAVAPLDPQVLNAKGSLFLTRPTLGHYTATRDELRARANDLFEWMRAGRLKVTIDKTLPLAQAAEAHRYLQSRQAMGKVLLIP